MELRVPPVGESISEVQLGDWLKSESSPIVKDEILVQLESEKATVDLPAPISGVLTRILKKRGETAKVGEVIALLQEGATVPASPTAASHEPQTATGISPTGSHNSAPSGTPATRRIVMPSAERILASAGVDPAAVQGTGVGGRITKADALRAKAPGTADAPQQASTASPSPAAPAVPSPASQPSPPPPLPPAAFDSSPDAEVVPMSPLRRTVARRLVEAQNAMAMLTTFNEVDMSGVIAMRKTHQEAFTARHGVKLGFMSFFVKSAIDALKAFPQLNAEIREQSIVYHRRYDVGVAIGGGKGLVVPIIRSADQLGFAEIEKSIADYGVRAKDGRIKPEELLGGTFTITNGGIYGSMLSTPIINPPQCAILGMHAIQDRAVVVDSQIVVRPMMYLALTYDHRIVDGREAVSFLKRVKETIESPARILLEV